MSEPKFVELQNDLFCLFEKGNFRDVDTFINKIQEEFPEKLDKTSFWKACLYAIQGKNEDAIAALEVGLSNGVWWNPQTLTCDPDLKNLQKIEEFKVIVKKCEVVLDSSRQNSKKQFITYGNQKSDTGIVSLHWKGSNAKDFSSYWIKNNMFEDYLFGFPQSSQVYGYNSYCWDNQEVAFKEVELAYREFKGLTMKQCILAGASQGGNLSIEMSLSNNLLGIKGFIAVIPAIQDVSLIHNLLSENGVSNLRGCIITGDKDPFYKKTLELVPIFEQYGLQCKWMIKEGLGHFFPSDFPKILTEAIEYILEPNKGVSD